MHEYHGATSSPALNIWQRVCSRPGEQRDAERPRRNRGARAATMILISVTVRSLKNRYLRQVPVCEALLVTATDYA